MAVPPGPAWDDGIKWIEGGAPNEVPDGGLPFTGAAICAVGAGITPTPSSLTVDAPPDVVPRGSSAALAGQVLYVADAALPIIHVIDMRSGAARELPPLVVTSVTEPTRRATATGLSVSPPTRDFKRYLYAIDSKDGSLIVYDVTDPVASPRTPLTRPHPETNPFQRPDRIAFSSPVATVGFARHEWPLAFSQTAPGAAVTGLLCNPNPNAGSANNTISADGVPDAGDLGVYYRPSSTLAVGPPNTTGFTGPSPYRLRGIFAFATLSTGAMVVIDVDDWDTPCRRPDPLGPTDGGAPVLVSAITPSQPVPAAGDIDPYHAQKSFQDNDTASNVTLESFFPVSAPSRTRSANFLRNDPSLGNFQPRIDTLPQLFSNSATVAIIRDNDRPSPLLIPTNDSNLVDPNEVATPAEFNPGKRVTKPLLAPNVRFSFESPEVHLDQDWTITFEGVVPGFKGITGELENVDGYQSITLKAPSALFCRRGVEDFTLGQYKATAVSLASTKGSNPPLTVPDRLTKKTGDYVQIIDDILANTDPYWATQDVNQCWDGPLADDVSPGTANASASSKVAADRYNACANTFGSGQDVNPVMSVQRDFPILEASQDKLVLGRFGYPDGQPPTTQSREIVAADKSNAPFLKLMRCCFHNQFQFNVRAASEWVTVGTKIGYLHHVTEGFAGRCVLSCNVSDSLLNSRAPVVSSVNADGSFSPSGLISRNSALAMRNPMFSFAILNGAVAGPAPNTHVDVYPDRDVQWRFTSRGQFVPLTINLAQTTSSVSPQSTRFIEALGQLAVVDGSAQGLMLIDLDLVTLAHSPYF
jgi:hypothetical protein